MYRILPFLTFLVLLTTKLSGQCPTLVWSDEFTGSTLNTSKWTNQIGDGCDIGLCGWGNNELQYYQGANAVVSGGTLKIIAKEETVNGKNYTSARIRTINKGDWTYGRFEASIKLPVGRGLWPAFWMLPTDNFYGTWPQSGEIDIMEIIGQEPDLLHGTIHYGPAWPNNKSKGEGFRLFDGIFNDQFHKFAIEWEENEIRWYIDDYLYSTITASDISPDNWPFDKDFHFLLNVAVGGNWPGPPDGSTSFPQTMEVEYVRVYDGFLPTITGKREVPSEASGEVYTIENAPAGATFTWTEPAGATIVSGQGTNSVQIDWGETGGTLSVAINNGCTVSNIDLEVKVSGVPVKEISLENFDEAALINLSSASGTLTDNFSNPSTTGINNSALVGKYVRNASEQYDNLQYTTGAIPNATVFTDEEKKFYIDLYTTAPLGTKVILQLENSATALPANYPTGRHSRYEFITTVRNTWERFAFSFVDRPDVSVSGAAVDKIVILFDPDSFNGHTYHFDNLDVYCASSDNCSVAGASITESVLENFDDPALITYSVSDGTYTQNLNNHAPNDVNNSQLVGRYIRNSSSQYDNIQFTTSAITDASHFVEGYKKFYLDIYTSAPIGTDIILQLENSAQAIPTNYPTGRHSRYTTSTKIQNGWERLVFSYTDRPDGTVANNTVDRIVLLFNSNSNTADTYYVDNFEVHCLNQDYCSNLDECISTRRVDLANLATGTYKADNVWSIGSVISGSDVMFLASDEITLESGFQAKSGADFIAKIENCSAALLEGDSEASARITTPILSQNKSTVAGKGIEVFPNPVASNLFIQLNNFEQGQLRLMDNTGRVLADQIIQLNAELDISLLPPGILFLQVMDQHSGEILTKKVIKK